MPKDACYHKVKARYKVFPSAYASGAIAKCRKVGAANYGTGGKKKKKAVGGTIKAEKGKITRINGGAKAQMGQFKNIINDYQAGKITQQEAEYKVQQLARTPIKKKKDGGLNAAIKKVKEETMAARDGKAIKMTKRKSKNQNIARGCGAIMAGRRKKTKYS